MLALVAKCLPQRAKDTLADIIPDRDELMKMVDDAIAFEKALVEKRKEKTDKKVALKLKKLLRK